MATLLSLGATPARVDATSQLYQVTPDLIDLTWQQGGEREGFRLRRSGEQWQLSMLTGGDERGS
jgi:hypothetical protein